MTNQPDLPPELLERVAMKLCRSGGSLCVGFCHARRCRDAIDQFSDYARAVAPILIAHGRELEKAANEADLTHAYLSGHAKGVVETEARAADQRCAELEAENARRGEALAFYAREQSWKSSGVYMSGKSQATSAEIDGGKRARKALENRDD